MIEPEKRGYVDRALDYIAMRPELFDYEQEKRSVAWSLSSRHADAGANDRFRAYRAAGVDRLPALFAAYFESCEANRIPPDLHRELYGPSELDLDLEQREAEQVLWNDESSAMETGFC